MIEKKLTTNEIGEVGESLVVKDLQQQGYDVVKFGKEILSVCLVTRTDTVLSPDFLTTLPLKILLGIFFHSFLS